MLVFLDRKKKKKNVLLFKSAKLFVWQSQNILYPCSFIQLS